MVVLRVDIPPERLKAFCQKWRLAELALFGSVLRKDFSPASDVDVMVSFAPGVTPRLADWVAMADELDEIFHHPVDLVTRASIEQSENWIKRREILQTATRLV